MKNVSKKALVLISLNVIFVLIATVLSAVSSGKAYAMSNLSMIIALGAADIVLGIVILALLAKKPDSGILCDLALWISVIAACMALGCVIGGRADLMGYVWFSDLEKNNATAVSALNLSVGAWVCYVIGIAADIVAGFTGATEAA